VPRGLKRCCHAPKRPFEEHQRSCGITPRTSASPGVSANRRNAPKRLRVRPGTRPRPRLLTHIAGTAIGRVPNRGRRVGAIRATNRPDACQVRKRPATATVRKSKGTTPWSQQSATLASLRLSWLPLHSPGAHPVKVRPPLLRHLCHPRRRLRRRPSQPRRWRSPCRTTSSLKASKQRSMPMAPRSRWTVGWDRKPVPRCGHFSKSTI
jgi:hypothetical protein